MPSHPPRKAFEAASKRAMDARQTWMLGSVVYKGVTYENVSVSVGTVEPTDVEGKTAWTQMITVSLPKCLLSSQPEAKALLTYKEQEYRVSVVGGLKEVEAAWLLRCLRFGSKR